MDKVMNVVIGTAVSVIGLLGLFLAARSVDTGIELFGLSLFLFGTGLNFWLIKSHFDRADQHK
jgi:hypothetical protein